MPSQKHLILFDIDQTLFDTPNYLVASRQPFADALKISPQELEAVTGNYLVSLTHNADFSPEKYLEYVAKKYNTDIATLRSIMYDKNTFGASLYPESRAVL